MLTYFKFHQDLLDPAPGKEIYTKPGPGRGWPEECPPIRAANAFGFDLLANFNVTFLRNRTGWRVQKDVIIESDFHYVGSQDSTGTPLTQRYAWFWEKGQKIPHPITDNVYRQIQSQVKLSSYLFLKSDANELLLMTDPPTGDRPWKAMTALVETDWYPASYPWHCVIELDPSQKRITIKKGDPICRVIPVRRDTYFAKPMSPLEFDDFFSRGQKWLATHGTFEHEGVADITRTYVRQQAKSKFVVTP